MGRRRSSVRPVRGVAAALGLVVSVVLVSACQALPFLPEPAPLVVQVEDDEGAPATVTVIDTSGIVIAAAPDVAAERQFQHGVSNAGPRQLAVGWNSFACEDRPEVTVTGSAEALRIVIDAGPRPGSCDSIGHHLSILLTLAEDVRAETVDVRLQQRLIPPPEGG